jgi:hypothetical protein
VAPRLRQVGAFRKFLGIELEALPIPGGFDLRPVFALCCGIASAQTKGAFRRQDRGKVEQLTAELEKLSEPELSRIRDWLDNFLEDQWEFTPEFEAAIQRSEGDRAQGRHTRTRKP